MNIQVNDKKEKIDFNLIDDLNTTMLINENIEEKNTNDIDTLLSMGFDQKMAKKVYVLLKPNNIDEAIYLLTKDNEKYHHYFIERYGKENECFICGLKPENHFDFLPRNTRNKNKDRPSLKKISKELKEINEPLISSEDKDNSSIDLKEKKFCNICFEQIIKKEIKENNIPCKHFFCSDCYYHNFKEKIETNDVSSIKCMEKGCPYEFDEKFIKSHLNGDNELFEKYKKFKKRNEIYKDPNLIICPIENCESYAKKEENNTFVKCLNGHEFCSQCQNPWHIGKKCKIGNLDSYSKEHHLKKCPKCGALTEKNLGCNHMKCNCGCNWCWFCKKEFQSEYEHFGVNGPCSNLQYTRNEFYNNCCYLCLHNTYIIIERYILLLFITFSLPGAYYLRKIRDDLREETFKKVLFCMKMIGIIYSIAYLHLFLPLGIPIILFFMCASSLKHKTIRYLLDLNDKET